MINKTRYKWKRRDLNEQEVLKLGYRVDEEGWASYNWGTNKLRNNDGGKLIQVNKDSKFVRKKGENAKQFCFVVFVPKRE